jgi:two-component system sensor histidine kinase ChvG
MASDIVTTILPRGRRRRRGGLAGVILAANFAALFVLIIGALVLNELRAGLVTAKTDSLRSQGSLLAVVLAEAAVDSDPPRLREDQARAVLRQLLVQPEARVRLFATDGAMVADSTLIDATINMRQLPPIGDPTPVVADAAADIVQRAQTGLQRLSGATVTSTLQKDFAAARTGEIAVSERFDETGKRVVAVTMPVQRVRAIVGVLTLESRDVDAIIAAERRSLVPFAFVAMLVALGSSAALGWSIVRPLRRLSLAADRVRAGAARRLEAADLADRDDEIGELADALDAMTRSLADRIDANARFAADVAHEIKNPLASIRNAADLLTRTDDAGMRARLEGMVAQDVRRLDRLVTDISNASRLDAELARTPQGLVSLRQLGSELVESYRDTAEGRGVTVLIDAGDDPIDSFRVRGREEALGRVVRNLIDNALSFSPEGGVVRVALARAPGRILMTVADDGPGIPPEALERLFERFYTDRPKSHGFGGHSGLGLSIARQIAEAHAGILTAANRPPPATGAVFTLDVPAAP